MARREEFRLPMIRFWQLLLLGAGFGLALAFGGPGTVSAQEGELVADCEGNSRVIDSACEFGDGQEFTVAIQVPSAPDGGYLGYQVRLRWDADILDYRPTDDPSQEVVWPSCDIPVREDNIEGSAVLFGCVRFTTQPTDYTGPLTLLTFVCTGQGTGSITPQGGDQESFFLDGNLQPVDPSLGAASVTCGGPEVDRPDPEVTLNPPPPLEDFTDPPDGNGQPPDEAVPGDVTETPDGAVTTAGDATPVVTPDATGEPAAIRLGDDDDAEDDDDDGGLPVWGWTLIGLAIAAGVGGGGFLAWRRMQTRGEEAAGDEGAARDEGAQPGQPADQPPEEPS